MKSWLIIGLSVTFLSLGLLVPEGHAGNVTQQQKEALKQMKIQHVSALKELKVEWKQSGLTGRGFGYGLKVKELNSQYKANLKTFKTSWNQPSNPIINNANPNSRSVPVPGTLLLFAGGFAGVMCWRARQPAV